VCRCTCSAAELLPPSELLTSPRLGPAEWAAPRHHLSSQNIVALCVSSGATATKAFPARHRYPIWARPSSRRIWKPRPGRAAFHLTANSQFRLAAIAALKDVLRPSQAPTPLCEISEKKQKDIRSRLGSPLSHMHATIALAAMELDMSTSTPMALWRFGSCGNWPKRAAETKVSTQYGAITAFSLTTRGKPSYVWAGANRRISRSPYHGRGLGLLAARRSPVKPTGPVIVRGNGPWRGIPIPLQWLELSCSRQADGICFSASRRKRISPDLPSFIGAAGLIGDCAIAIWARSDRSSQKCGRCSSVLPKQHRSHLPSTSVNHASYPSAMILLRICLPGDGDIQTAAGITTWYDAADAARPMNLADADWIRAAVASLDRQLKGQLLHDVRSNPRLLPVAAYSFGIPAKNSGASIPNEQHKNGSPRKGQAEASWPLRICARFDRNHGCWEWFR